MEVGLEIVYYPDQDSLEDPLGPIGRFYKDLRKSHPDLWALVHQATKSVKDAPDLESLKNQKWVERISYSNYPLYEFRIPPQRRGGVVRLYFAYKKNNSKTIVILSAELKKGKKANPEKIKQAEKRYQEVCI